ncbi:MAG: response regulator transcription factor [Candidatus Riflebacteria bacterium]
MKKILVIDDDVELCSLLEEYLESEGFTTRIANAGKHALELATSHEFDLITLDVMLPEINGIELLKKIRGCSKVPVIMLTARGDEVDRILGLELGADDYLPKPFSPRELVARIRAIFRRTEGSAPADLEESSRIQVADLVIDRNTRVVLQNGEPIACTEVEFSILDFLLQHAGQVVDRQELAEKSLGRRLDYFDRSLDVHMSNLRRKLGHHLGDLERIKTIRGAGYLYVKP